MTLLKFTNLFIFRKQNFDIVYNLYATVSSKIRFAPLVTESHVFAIFAFVYVN